MLFGTVNIPIPSPGYRSWCGYPDIGNDASFLTVGSCFDTQRIPHSLFIALLLHTTFTLLHAVVYMTYLFPALFVNPWNKFYPSHKAAPLSYSLANSCWPVLKPEAFDAVIYTCFFCKASAIILCLYSSTSHQYFRVIGSTNIPFVNVTEINQCFCNTRHCTCYAKLHKAEQN